MITNYIYLLKLREFVRNNENVYKIGMTKQENHKRFNQYPKGSILLFQIICEDCLKSEKEIIGIFKTKFIHRNDLGNEYFEGDFKTMIELIYCNVKDSNCEDVKAINNKTEAVMEYCKVNKNKDELIYDQKIYDIAIEMFKEKDNEQVFNVSCIRGKFIILIRNKASKCWLSGKIHGYGNSYLVINENDVKYFVNFGCYKKCNLKTKTKNIGFIKKKEKKL